MAGLVVERELVLSYQSMVVLVAEQGMAGLAPIYFDQAADAGLDEMTKKVSTDEAAFTLKVDGKGISIRGLSHEGSLFGCYELLEQLGIRWFMPGEIGYQSVNMTRQRTTPLKTSRATSACLTGSAGCSAEPRSSTVKRRPFVETMLLIKGMAR